VALGIDVEPLDALGELDIAIDGADQVDPRAWLIKGGGGAHTREKIVVTAARRFKASDAAPPAEGAHQYCAVYELDVDDLMGEQAYTLEVTSRGVDRPLTEPRHWRRNTGRLVKVVLDEGDPVTGRIAETDDTGAVLDVEGADHRVEYAAVKKAKIQIEFKKESL